MPPGRFETLCVLGTLGQSGQMVLVASHEWKAPSGKRTLAEMRSNSRLELDRALQAAVHDVRYTNKLVGLANAVGAGWTSMCPPPDELRVVLLEAFDRRRLSAICVPPTVETDAPFRWTGPDLSAAPPSSRLAGASIRAAEPGRPAGPVKVADMSPVDRIFRATEMGIALTLQKLKGEEGQKLLAQLAATVVIAGAVIVCAKLIAILLVGMLWAGIGIAVVVGVLSAVLVAMTWYSWLLLGGRLIAFVAFAGLADDEGDLEIAADAFADAFIEFIGDMLPRVLGGLAGKLAAKGFFKSPNFRKLMKETDKSITMPDFNNFGKMTTFKAPKGVQQEAYEAAKALNKKIPRDAKGFVRGVGERVDDVGDVIGAKEDVPKAAQRLTLQRPSESAGKAGNKATGPAPRKP